MKGKLVYWIDMSRTNLLSNSDFWDARQEGQGNGEEGTADDLLSTKHLSSCKGNDQTWE